MTRAFSVNDHIQIALGMKRKAGGPYLTTVRALGADVPVYIGEYGWCRPLVSVNDGDICWVADDSYTRSVRFSDGSERFAVSITEAIALVEDGVDLRALKKARGE